MRLFCALLLLTATLAAQAPVLQQGRLTFQGQGWKATVAATSEGALRLTVHASGRTPDLRPESLELGQGPAPQPAGAQRWAFGSATLTAVAGGRMRVDFPGIGPLEITLGATPAGALQAEWTAPRARCFHGFGQVAKQVAFQEADLELYHHPEYGDQTYLHLPFAFTDTGAAISLNAAGRDRLEVVAGRTLRLTSTSGQVDAYLFAEADPRALVARHARMTGARSLLPRWAFGYLQSRYGYRTEAEVRATVQRFRQWGLPLSAIVLDHYWFKQMGDLNWDRTAFPDPQELAHWLHGEGVRLVTISEPFIHRKSQLYPAFEAAGGLARGPEGRAMVWKDWWDFGQGLGGGVVDPTAPGAQDLLRARYAALATEGVDGFWIDLGEPERVPAAACFGPYTEEAYHNTFNLAWARLVREGFLRAFPGRRPFILSRSGSTGITGLGVSTWSGDVPATWRGLRDQIPLGLSASLSGLPYWGSDVGGFITQGGDAMPPDPELYLRWQQFGAFTPVHRAHGAGPREPWIYGPEWMARVKAVLELRQRLGPYIYSTAWQAWTEGVPLMRPLFFLEPTNPDLRAEAGCYTFGDAFLVAPVTQPLAKATTRTLRLPQGTWVDAFTLERHVGGREVKVPLTLDRFPLFYREGAIVPVALEAGQEGLVLIPGNAPSRFTVFNDDGETEAYRRGAGERMQVDLEATGVTISGVTRARELLLQLPKSVPLGPLAAQATGADERFNHVRVSLHPGTQRFTFGRP
jgi:alpha-glucosidase (family GH31 glycosyl hydrolase)